MIYAVRCDKPSFREVTFTKGLNIVLAERTIEATDKDSRNGLGKTTLLDIIHFCLGSTANLNHVLRKKELENWTFTLDFEINGQRLSVSRNTTSFGIIDIDGEISNFPIAPSYDNKRKKNVLKINDWTRVLSSLTFDLPITEIKTEYSPTFRSLISYFIRLGIGAFESPFEHFRKQQEWDIQVNNAFLLELNWKYASEFQVLKDKKNTLQELQTASKQGMLAGFLGSLGELEAERIRNEDNLNVIQKQLADFKVHFQYREIESSVNIFTKDIHEIVNKNSVNRQFVQKYQDSLIVESDVDLDNLINVYERAGLVFPEKLTRDLASVMSFHKQLISNRRDYLESEITRLLSEIENNNKNIESLSNKRSELMKVLQTHGAFEEYSLLQKSANQLGQQTEDIKNKINNLQKIEEWKSSLAIERQELLQKARRDYHERKKQIEAPIILFNKNSEYLYSEPGVLSIDITNTGYKFNVDIKRAKSQGISYMKVFCYDMTLLQLRSQKRAMPNFLIHDSTIFDGVDERQIAKALELAHQSTTKDKTQYICTLNSDMIPFKDFSGEFKNQFDQSIRIKLTDATPEGGLLGIRF